MCKTIILTRAYNAEKTLRMTIDSVLNQSYKNYVYYVIDNGSTDGTGEIIKEYAAKDGRIIHWRNEINNIGKSEIDIFSDPSHSDNDFYCAIDADDEYKHGFLEKTLAFMNENALDIAAAGNDFIEAQTNRVTGIRSLNQDLILEDAAFSLYFRYYYQFMRTIWGKLYKLSLLRQCDFENYMKRFSGIRYGGDTLFVMQAFRHAKRVGIIAESMHKYYMSPKSTSYSLDKGRIDSDRILHELAKEYLFAKVGHINPENRNFLCLVHFNAIKDTLNIVMNTDIAPLEKLEAMQDIFTHDATRELKNSEVAVSKEYQVYFDNVTKWILSQSICRRLEGAKLASEIIAAMYEDLVQPIKQDSLQYLVMKMPEVIEYLLQKDYNRILERLHTWYKRHESDEPALTQLEIFAYRAVNKPDYETFELLAGIKKKRSRASKELNIDKCICELIGTSPLLKSISADLAANLPHVVRWILKGNLPKALDAFISASRHMEIVDNDAESYIILGQNLSAAVGDSNSYIYFKKVWISYLLDSSRVEEARTELDEFAQLMPEDEDFITLRNRLIF